MKYFTTILLAIVTLSAFSCDPAKNEISPDLTAEKKYDLSYGPDPRNKLDVYLPAHRNSNTPFVLLIHGGGWTAGNKSDFNLFQDTLMARGIASASMSYRYVSNTIHYQQLMADVHAALTYCAAQADNWKTRNTGFVVAGASAGAHMSLLYSYSYDDQHKVSAVISLAGPTDITDVNWLNYAASLNLAGGIESMVGATYTPNQPLPAPFAAASPIKNVRNLPTLMIHGTADNVVFYSQSQALDAKLAAMGIPHKLVTIPNAGHDLGLANPLILQLVINEFVSWTNTYGK
jgi:acetyl esterase/lipase